MGSECAWRKQVIDWNHVREHHFQLYMYIRLLASTVDLFNIFIIFTLKNDMSINK